MLLILFRVAFYGFGLYGVQFNVEWAVWVAFALLMIEYVPTILSPNCWPSTRKKIILLNFIIPGVLAFFCKGYPWIYFFVGINFFTQLYMIFNMIVLNYRINRYKHQAASATSPQGQFCQHCGSPIQPGNFCSSCGNRL